MKKILVLISAVLVISMLCGCGFIGGIVKNAVSGSQTDSGDERDIGTDGGNSDEMSESDIQSVIDAYSAGDSINWAGYTQAEKNAIKEAAAKEGVEINETSGDGLSFSDENGSYIYGGEWPENEYTKQIPKPEKGSLLGSVNTDTEFAVVLTGVTVDDVRSYADAVKKAGFTVDAAETDEEFLGIAVYTYSALNQNGYKIEIGSSMGVNTLTMTKN